MRIPENVTEEKLSADLVKGVVDINELNLAKKVHRDALMSALKKRKALLRAVKEENAEHILSYVIAEMPEYFLYLERKQYTEKLAQAYLYYRFHQDETDKSNKDKSLFVQKSTENKVVFSYAYTTEEGDELCYFDKELEVPLAIKSAFKVRFRIEKAVHFIDSFDTQIAQLGLHKVKTLVEDLIVGRFKSFLSAFMDSRKIGYYSLCTSLEDVEQGFKKKANGVLDDYGVEITDFFVKKLAIPKDVQSKIEDQELRLRLRRAEVRADAEFAKLSMENYQTKLALEEKYPQGNHSLTEYEKDLALKRYLIKTGRHAEEKVDRSVGLTATDEVKDREVETEKDVVPEVQAKRNVFKSTFFSLLFVCLIISLVTISNNLGTGLILLGVTVALFGTVAAFTLRKFRKDAVESDEEEVENNGNDANNG